MLERPPLPIPRDDSAKRPVRRRRRVSTDTAIVVNSVCFMGAGIVEQSQWATLSANSVPDISVYQKKSDCIDSAIKRDAGSGSASATGHLRICSITRCATLSGGRDPKSESDKSGMKADHGWRVLGGKRLSQSTATGSSGFISAFGSFNAIPFPLPRKALPLFMAAA